jgi:manganese/zinc/iron transport system substrate-binding protein
MKSLAFRIILTVPIIFGSCGKEAGDKTTSSEMATPKTIRVVTTIGMISDIVSQIGGDRVTVTGLMGPGVDPHLYKASEGDVARMAEADIIFYNGLHLEGKMAEVLEKLGQRIKTAAVAEAIDHSVLLAPPEFEGAYDPHVWFDVSLWSEAVTHVRDVLTEYDAAGTDIYRENAQRYLADLSDLHEYVKAEASTVPENRRVIVTAHDAFNYFGRAYGFEVRGLQGISTASEAGTADVKALAEFIVERKIPAVFVETSVPPRYIEALQAAVAARGFVVEIGGNLYSDAMGDPNTEAGNYIGMVRSNIDTIVDALSTNE